MPYGPGGSADQVARIYAEKLSASLGQQVIVEDKPGASGGVGAQMVATGTGRRLHAAALANRDHGHHARGAEGAVQSRRPRRRGATVDADPGRHPHQCAGREGLGGVRGAGQGEPGQVLVRLVGPRHHHASHRRGADARRRHPDAALALQDHRRRHGRRVRRAHPDGVRSVVRALRQGGQGARRAVVDQHARMADLPNTPTTTEVGLDLKGFRDAQLVRPLRAQGNAASPSSSACRTRRRRSPRCPTSRRSCCWWRRTCATSVQCRLRAAGAPTTRSTSPR